MNDHLRKQFEEQLTYLPDVNQKALKSFDWATELLAIGKTYGLHIDQLDDLQVETMLTLVGLVNADDYENELITRLALSPTETHHIVEDVNKRIFTPIYNYIVSGGPKEVTTPVGTMESAGFTMTNDEAPVATPTVPLVRTGGSTPPNQVIPESRPSFTSPLTFHPNAAESAAPEMPTTPVVVPLTPSTEPTVSTSPIQSPILSKEKLEKLIHDRQQIVDATIQSMEQKNA